MLIGHTWRASLAAALLSGTLICATALPASAVTSAPSGDDDGIVYPPSASLVVGGATEGGDGFVAPSNGGDRRTNDASSVSPLAVPVGCNGYTDNPHLSANGYDVSVWGRTVCSSYSTSFKNHTYLYRMDWWGENQMADSWSPTKVGTGTAKATTHANCNNAPNRQYLGRSYHTAVVGGLTGTAVTENYENVTC